MFISFANRRLIYGRCNYSFEERKNNIEEDIESIADVIANNRYVPQQIITAINKFYLTAQSPIVELDEDYSFVRIEYINDDIASFNIQM